MKTDGWHHSTKQHICSSSLMTVSMYWNSCEREYICDGIQHFLS